MGNLIPPGTYRAVAVPVDVDGVATYAQFGVSKEKQTKQVCVNFEILDDAWAGVRLAWFGYFTQKTWERTVESLRYCGFKGDDLESVVRQALDQEVSIVVEHHEYNGKTYARVAWVNASGGGGMKLANQMSANDLRMFSAQMKQRGIGKIGEVAGKKAERSSRSTTSRSDFDDGPGDDAAPPNPNDIPF